MRFFSKFPTSPPPLPFLYGSPPGYGHIYYGEKPHAATTDCGIALLRNCVKHCGSKLNLLLFFSFYHRQLALLFCSCVLFFCQKKMCITIWKKLDVCKEYSSAGHLEIKTESFSPHSTIPDSCYHGHESINYIKNWLYHAVYSQSNWTNQFSLRTWLLNMPFTW